MATKLKKVVGASAIGALSLVEMLHLQQAAATPVSFSGSSFSNPKGGSVQVSITVDGASGTYRIVGVSTPVQPTGQNAPYANLAIPTLTNEAIAAQSAAINGVSGASEISAAWKNSLSSAIAAASAAGQSIGSSSTPPAPTPTPSATVSTPGAPSPSASATATASSTPAGVAIAPPGPGPQEPLPTTGTWVVPSSVGLPPIFMPLNIPPFVAPPPTTGTTTGTGTGTSFTPNYSGYLAQISGVLATLSQRIGEDLSSGAAASARAGLTALQAQVQNDLTASKNQPQSQTPAPSQRQDNYASVLSTYVANMNSQLSYIVTMTNKAITEYYVRVQAAANHLYADAQASAAALSASPSPTPTVTVTVTATPVPTSTATPIASESSTSASFSIVTKPGLVIRKTYTCVKTVGGKTTKKLLQGIIMKCPTGFTLLKK